MRILLVLFSVLLSQLGYAQANLSGTIADETTGMPLPSASIYIVELNKGTLTDADGHFEFSNLGNGSFQLTVSYLGYQSKVQEVAITNDQENLMLDIKLQQRTFQMNEVVVSNAYVNSQNDNTYDVSVIKKDKLYTTNAITVMDLIEDVPGVDAITTGPLVSRPVIRGLSGNRVLTVTDGTRFETQQWDDEHGLGLNELGVDRIEVIKGPASLLYGPEAMGGVVNFIPEAPAPVGNTEGEAIAALSSNNLGFYGNANIKGSKEHITWGVNALGRLLSDYFYNGYSFRVPNTRLLEYGAKGYAGINGEWGSSKLTYTFNKAFYGILDGKDIVIDENGQITNIDSLETEKFPFEIEAPFHEVTDNRVVSKTTLLTGKSKIEATVGYQNNRRAENEELSGVKKGYRYLDMQLQTATYDIKWYLPTWHNFETIVGSQGLYKKNKNKEGAATQLIPDAAITDLGMLAVTKYSQNAFTASLGARYDTRNLESVESMTADLNMPAITRNYDNVSASIGASYQPFEKLLMRASYASGYRSPNLNELFANGVKLESQRYEKGNVDFKKETNNEIDFSAHFDSRDFSIEASVFFTSIQDYIYIAPTGETVESNIEQGEFYPAYQFYQSDAKIKGGEALVDIHPSTLPWTHLESKLATLEGTRSDDDSYLPMMPPSQLSNTLFFSIKHFKDLSDIFIDVGTETAFEQTQVAENESETPSYTLLNAGVGAHINHALITLTAHNVLDKTYLNHMSRFRSYNIIEPGINVELTVKMPLAL